MAKFYLQKMTKNNLRIISKPHACFQTMTKTPVKFQKNRYKTVGVAPTREAFYSGLMQNPDTKTFYRLIKMNQTNRSNSSTCFIINGKSILDPVLQRITLKIHIVKDNARKMAKFNLPKK